MLWTTVIIMQVNLFVSERQSFDNKRLFKNLHSFSCRSTVPAEVSFPTDEAPTRFRIFSSCVVAVFTVDTAPRFLRRRFSSRTFAPPQSALTPTCEVVSHVKSQSHSAAWVRGGNTRSLRATSWSGMSDSSIVHRWHSRNNRALTFNCRKWISDLQISPNRRRDWRQVFRETSAYEILIYHTRRPPTAKHHIIAALSLR